MRRSGYLSLLLALLAVLAILVGGVVLLLYQLIYADRIYPQVEVVGVKLGGLTPQEAEARLEEASHFLRQSRVSLRYGDEIWRVSPYEVGAQFHVKQTMARAYQVGRGAGILADAKHQFQALRYGQVIPPVLQFDEGRSTLFLIRLAEEIRRSPREARLIFDDLAVHISPGQAGQELDIQAAKDLFRQRIAHLPDESIELPIKEMAPGTIDLDSAKLQIEKMLSAPLYLVFEEGMLLYEGPQPVVKGAPLIWALDRGALADMLVLRQEQETDGASRLIPSLDQGKLTAYLEEIAAQIEQTPREGRFEFDPKTGQLTPLITSQEGRTLDIPQTLRLIEAQVGTSEREIRLPVTIERPAVSTGEAESLDIRELISKGISYFKGSSPERMRNIQVGSAQFHGVVIPPGETFSFNEHLGEVVDARGYLDSYIIFGDRTVLGPGGGICQVSTTTFRAAFFAGLPIIERWPHSYRVGWYEPPVGLDATIFTPAVDFKFKNNTSAHILIQTEADTKNGVLTFYFYGTKPNRTVEMEGPEEENLVEPGPPIYEEDPTLPKGVVKQVDRAHDGLDVTIYRIIKEGDKVVSREAFFSRYKPWSDRFLVGTREEEGQG